MTSMTYKTPEHIQDTIKEHQDLPSMYIYDMEVFRNQVNNLVYLPQQVDTFYAMKVNPHPEVIAEALKHPNISWIEVASQWEEKIVLEQETELNNVIYTWPSKTPQELNLSVVHNIQYLNVESLVEAVRINLEAEKKWIIQPILLRLNTKHKFNEWETWVKLWSADTQFWLAQDETIENLKILSQLKNIRVDWFHMYPASQIMEADVVLRSVEETFKFVDEIEQKTWIEFSTVDFGWGFWVDYGWFKKFNIVKYGNELEKLINKYGFKTKRFILELWRYLWADMWYFVTKINDIKKIWKENKWILCHAWTNAHKRPQVLGVDYHIDIVKIHSNTNKEVYNILKGLWVDKPVITQKDITNIYWPFCTSVDYLAKWKTWLEAEIWDYIVMPQAGAYWKTMSPQKFLSHPDVPEIIINK